MQHVWATAVETVGTFIRQALKSSQGERDWLRFFALMSGVLAHIENTPKVPGIPDNIDDIRKEVRQYAQSLDVRSRLQTYGSALQQLDTAPPNAHYFLMVLDAANKTIKITGYPSKLLDRASQDYLEIEEKIRGDNKDAVLVSVESVAALRAAYPNYFLDTNKFAGYVTRVVGDEYI